jgi:glycosyltransferase involved in cell wall biosynthesis
MIKILHLIVDLEIGGAELMLKRMLEAQKKNPCFYNIVVSLTTLGPVGKQLQLNGIEVHSFEMNTKLMTPLIILKLVKLIKKSSVDLVQTWMYHADLIGGLAAKISGSCPVIWGVRSTKIPQGFFNNTYWLIRICASLSNWLPNKIVCCADSARKEHESLGYLSKKMIVIPNGYNFSFFDSQRNSRAKARSKIGYSDRDVVIGIVGRFDPLKDFNNFILAAEKLSILFAHTKFLMIGRGVDWSNLQLSDWIKSKGLEDKFILLGEKLDIPFYLSAMDIFCMSSVSEGFPNSVVEAMAMGLPCVVTKAGDVNKIIHDKSFVVPVNDSSALSEALLRMCRMKHKNRQLIGENNSKKVRLEFEINNISKQYEILYKDIIANEQKKIKY